MGDVKIDADNFCAHIKALYKSWEKVSLHCHRNTTIALPCLFPR